MVALKILEELGFIWSLALGPAEWLCENRTLAELRGVTATVQSEARLYGFSSEGLSASRSALSRWERSLSILIMSGPNACGVITTAPTFLALGCWSDFFWSSLGIGRW